MSDRYRNSEKLLEQALRTIPLGTQTFSKSKTQFPFGVSPYFIERGKGSHIWDVDGHEYVDFGSSLCAVNLGYADPDVNAAVRAQLEQGTIFSLPHPLEIQVAEKMREMIPCAEMTRFGKNGSDVTSGAIRLARALTSRDHVAVCGYHGWQDWYIGSTTRNLGVPASIRSLTHTFAYNAIDSLHTLFNEYKDQIAAVILEPMNITDPKGSFLQEVKELAHKNKSLFIFDETITGFRYAKGGAQEYFGVTPDLATFGKGIANGFPLSALSGRADLMKLMEEIFFSFTFGGETLSLAAALTTMKKIQTQPVIETMRVQGTKIIQGIQKLIEKRELEDVLSVSGHPAWSFLHFKDFAPYTLWQLKTLYYQEIFARGILTLGSHNLSYSHSDDDVAKLLTVYDETFGILKQAISEKSLEKQLRCEVLKPLFKVR